MWCTCPTVNTQLRRSFFEKL